MKRKLCALFLAVLMVLPLSGCVVEGLMIVTVATLVAGIGDHYALRTNWGIQLPDGYEELYGMTEVGRDGDRYHVIRYDSAADLDALQTVVLTTSTTLFAQLVATIVVNWL